VGAVDEGLGEIELPALSKVLRETAQDLWEHAFLDPALKTTVTRLIRRVSAR